MGSWGSAPFDNDDASDWSYEVLDGGGPEAVASALREVVIDDPPELPDAAAAVGAAALVAGALGVTVDLPDELAAWLSSADRDSLRGLAPEAVVALDRVLDDSELGELWDETGDDEWRDATRRMRDGIAAAS